MQRRKLVQIDAATVERMRSAIINRSEEALNDQFGISYNTWRKIEIGHPVRSSLAERLLVRVSALGNE